MKHSRIRTGSFSTVLLLALSTALPLPAQDAELMDAVVVTGSNVLEPLASTPVRTELLSNDVIVRSASRTLAEAVENSPGIRIDTTCSNCGQQTIQMLGLPTPYIGILTDSLPNFSGLAGVYGLEQIPAGLADRLEIVKGGGSVLYGPGAVAGVINIIPRDPTESGFEFRAQIENMEGDSFGQGPSANLFAISDWVNEDGTLRASAFFNYNRLQPLDINGDGFTDISLRELLSGGARFVWEPDPDHRFSLDYFISDETRRGGDTGAGFRGPPNFALIAEEIFSRRHIVTAKWEGTLSDAWSARLAYSFARTDRASYYGGTAALGSPDPLSPFFDPTWTPGRGFGTTLDDLHFIDSALFYEPSEEHRFTFGMQYRSEDLTDSQATVGRNLDVSFSNLGLLAQHRWTASEMWTFEYGARIDFNSELNDPIISPRAALLVTPSGDFRIRSSFSTGFRAPEIFDEDLHISNVGGALQTTFLDPALREESAVTFAIAPEWQITDRWRLEFNAFYTLLQDTFVNQPNDDPLTPNVLEFLKVNGEESTIFGGEINLGYFADTWSAEFSWVEQRLEYENPQLLIGGNPAVPADNPIFSGNFPRTPESMGQLRLTASHPWFDPFLTLRVTGPMDIPRIVSDAAGNLVRNELNLSPWFFNIDVGIRKEFQLAHNTVLTLNLGVRNLLNDFQHDLEVGAFRDAGYIYGPAFPRTLFAGVTIQF